MNAELVDPGVLYRMENNLLTTKRVRGSWSSTVTTVVIAIILICLIIGFLVAQYNSTLKLRAVEAAQKNIPFTQVAWNNAVRNVAM